MRIDPTPLVAPFAAEHFAELARLSELLAPPYDVISQAEREVLARRHDHNIVSLILPQGNGDRYAEAARRLVQWRRDGVLVASKSAAVYVVQQEFVVPGGCSMTRTGLMGAVAAEPFDRGRIKPHERTHAGPKQDRLLLLRATRTMFESLLMLARDPSGDLMAALDAVTSGAPWAVGRVGDDQVRAWRVGGQAGQRLAEIAGRDALYIADGHHRFETAVTFRNEFPAADRTLALIVSLADPGLVVLPTHRLIHGPSLGDDVMSRLSAQCNVAELHGADPQAALTWLQTAGGGCVVVLRGGRLHGLTRRAGADPHRLEPFHPAVRQLDVTWADAYVVAMLREACNGRVDYSSVAGQVADQVRAGAALAGVLLNPPAVADVLAVADAGGFMPQKSTYFLPKVPSGLVMLPHERR